MNIVATHRRRLVLAVLALCLSAVAIFNFLPKTEAESGPAAVPIIGATKTAALVAGNGDADADPGDTIEYTVTINNTGPDPALGVTLADTIQNITTLVPGSANIQPNARDNTFNTIGNVNIVIPDGAGDLLDNDNDLDGGTVAMTGFGNTLPTANSNLPGATITSTNGGSLTVNANGSFTYNPPRGVTTTETFFYTVSDGQGGTDTAQVTVNIAGKIWFINNTAGACTVNCDGRLTNPYTSTTNFQAANTGTAPNPTAGDFIFVYTGTSVYNGSIILLNNQRLIGQGASQTILAITGLATPSGTNQLPGTGAAPTLGTTGATANAVTIANAASATIRGLNIGATTGAKIISSPAPPSSAFGTLTVSEVALSGNGQALNLDNGVLAATFTSIATTSSVGAGISLDTVGGSLTVSPGGTTVSGSTTQGILITSSAVATSWGTTTVTGGTNGISLSGMSGNLTMGTVSINGQSGDGINITNSTGSVIASGGAIGNTNDPAGNAVEVNGSNGNVTIPATLTKTTAGKIVLVTARTGNTVAFSGNISATGGFDNGIDVNSNPAGITNFTGQTQTLTTGANTAVNLFTNGTGVINFAPVAGGNGLDIATTSGLGFRAATGGTVTVQGSGNTITSTTATALNVNATTIGATNLNFQSISSGAATNNGISLDTTGSSGGLIVNGDGTNTSVGGNSTGGTIAGKSGADGNNTQGIGIYLNNTSNVVLRRMTINGTNQNFGVRGIGVSGFTMEFSTVNGNNGTSVGLDEGSVNFDNLLGSAAITSCLIEGGLEDNLNVVNTSGSLNRLTITGSTFGFNNTANGNNNILIESQNAGTTLNFTLQSSIIRGARADWINFSNNSSSTMDAVIGGSTPALGNTFDNLSAGFVHPGAAAGGNRVVGGAVGVQTVDIRNNTMKGSKGEAIRVRSTRDPSANTGIVDARVRNNTIGVAGTANSGSSEGIGIFIFVDGGGDADVAVTDNVIRQTNNSGIRVQVGDEITPPSNVNATVTGNSFSNPGNLNTDFGAIHLNHGTVLATDDFTSCIDIGGAGGLANTTTNYFSGVIPPNNAEIRLQQRQATTVRLPGYVGANNNDAAVVSYLAGRNVSNTEAASNTVPTGGGFVNTPGGAPCTQPIVPLSREIEAGDSDDLAFLNSSYDAPLAILTDLDCLERQLAAKWADNGNLQANNGYPQTDNGHPQSDNADVRADSGDVQTEYSAVRFVSDVVSRLGEMISPTAYAQDEKKLAPESGETVNKGPFTLPANESVIIKFRVTVDNGPYASGVNNITNTATVSGSNFTTVNPSSAPIALDAAPDLVVVVSDSGSTTQPGAVLAYTVTYSNTTAINGQHAANVRVSQTVPANATFNATVSGAGWSCPDGSPATTVCTFDVGAVNAGAPSAALNFALNVLPLLPVGAVQISDTGTIAENPANANGTDRVPANNSSTDTTNIIGNWLGTTSTVWETSTNWSNNVIPPPGNSISIPNATNQPVLGSNRTVNLLTLNKNLTIGSGFTLTSNGNVTLGTSVVDGAGTLELGTAAAISRTTGQVNSTLRKNFGGPGPLFVLPVGTTGAYSPLDVTVTAGSGQLTVKANTGNVPPLNDAVTLDRFWTLTESGDLTANLLFTYLQADVDGNELNYRTIRVTGGVPTGLPNGAPCPGVGSPCVDPGANTIKVNGVSEFSDWTAGEFAPTAANVRVSGRVADQDGRGIPFAQVLLLDQGGHTIWANTNPFGYYRFAGVPSGQTYLISVRHKRFEFQPRAVTVHDDLTGIDFTPDPEP